MRVIKIIGASLTIAIIVLILFFSFTSEHPSANQSFDNKALTTELNELLAKEPKLKGAMAGVSVRSMSTGEELFDHLGDTRLRPASNMKLLTGAVALNILGEDYTFKTELTTDGEVDDNQLNGNLYLVGKGDPTLLKSDLDQLAKQLRQSGIKQVNGDVVADDSWYDDVRLSRDLVWEDEESYYGAQISALTLSPNKEYDAGTVIVEVFPGEETGSDAVVKVTPKNDYISIQDNAYTVPSKVEGDIEITREHGTNNIIIEGMIPDGAASIKKWVSVWEPTEYALSIFKQSLKKYGVIWTGDVRVGEAKPNSKKLVTDESIPLSELLTTFMKLSNNGHAEVLVKEMGKVVHNEGSWESGIKVMQSELEKFGIDTETLVIRDGSGLSHVNLLPANEISKLLYHIKDEKWFESYFRSLPVAGNANKMIGGTLRYRLHSTEAAGHAHAKTGTLSTVSGLSGYVTTKSGEELIFSILINNILDSSDGKDVEDKIVALLAEQ